MAYLTIVNTLVCDVEEGRGGGQWKNLAVILTLTVALLVLDDDII